MSGFLKSFQCDVFVKTLDKLYVLSKAESRAGFPNLKKLVDDDNMAQE